MHIANIKSPITIFLFIFCSLSSPKAPVIPWPTILTVYTRFLLSSSTRTALLLRTRQKPALFQDHEIKGRGAAPSILSLDNRAAPLCQAAFRRLFIFLSSLSAFAYAFYASFYAFFSTFLWIAFTTSIIGIIRIASPRAIAYSFRSIGVNWKAAAMNGTSITTVVRIRDTIMAP